MSTVDAHTAPAVPDPELSARSRAEFGSAMYIAAVGGALIATLADILGNRDTSTVGKLATLVHADSPTGYAVGVFVLVLAAGFLCWVYAPASRVEAFTRGLSVLTVLSVVNPFQDPAAVGVSSMAPTPVVFPAPLTRSINSDPTLMAMQATAYIQLEADGPVPADFEVHVTLRKAESRIVVARQRFATSAFVVIQPEGRYILELEADGYRRTSTTIGVTAGRPGYRVHLETSDVPLVVQRLYAPADVEATALEATPSGI